MTATEPVDLLIRAADAGDTYLTWRWLDDPTRPDYHVLDADQLAGPLDRLASSLVALLPGESQAQAVERALSRGAFADPDRERAFAAELAATLLPPRLGEQLADRCAAGPVRIRLTPSPRLAQLPWELLPVGDRRLLQQAELVYEPPAAVHAHRSMLPDPWAVARHRPALFVIDPEVPRRAPRSLRRVLDRADIRAFADRLGEHVAAGRLPVAEAGVPARIDRIQLGAALRTPRSRLLYFGHVTATPDEPGSAALHLNDTRRIWGTAEPLRPRGSDGPAAPHDDDHRPLAALDLLSGTTLADEPVWRGFGADGPAEGPELWPMPPRVALIVCEGGADYRTTETFGLIVAMVNAGAELVTTTRWVLPANTMFRAVAPDARPTSELALRVDRAHEGDDPIGELRAWQCERLHAWESTGRIADTPLVWAALTNSIAPRRPDPD